jgi:ankyrin repeat protein
VHGFGFPFVFQGRDLPALGSFEALQPVSHEAIVLAVRNGFSAAVVELLLYAGFSANSTATSGISVLGLASQYGCVHLVNLLIHWNADINFLPTNSDQALTPLLLAASNGHADVLRSLLRAGARPTSDACAAARAGGYTECVELLLDVVLDLPETSKTNHARAE